jgi:energy-converting hydrogenase Eha subunit H
VLVLAVLAVLAVVAVRGREVQRRVHRMVLPPVRVMCWNTREEGIEHMIAVLGHAPINGLVLTYDFLKNMR